jgi:hypothetical protein
MDAIFNALLLLAGIFALLLGLWHFFFPILFDFDHAIPLDGPPLKPFRPWYTRAGYPTSRADVRGIAWVSNHAASFGLVTAGVLDLAAGLWLGQPLGWVVALWIAGWWFLRAGSQLYLGRRRGDWLIVAGFAALGLLHVWAAARALSTGP